MAGTSKKHIITIAGRPGSGKSTAAKAVAKQLGYEHFSSGDLFRVLAQEMDINVLDANLTAEQNAEIDHSVDGRLQEIARTEDFRVIDSRTAWHWMPSSFKVFLDLDLDTAAERILSSMDEHRLNNEHIPLDPHEYAGMLQERLASESRRYKKLYNIDPYKMSNYDLVVDTAVHNAEEVTTLITDSFQKWLDA